MALVRHGLVKNVAAICELLGKIPEKYSGPAQQVRERLLLVYASA